jgi:hypothetical protein
MKTNKPAHDPVLLTAVQIIKGETLLQVAPAINDRPIVKDHSGVKNGSRHETEVDGFTLRPLWARIHAEQ